MSIRSTGLEAAFLIQVRHCEIFAGLCAVDKNRGNLTVSSIRSSFSHLSTSLRDF